LTRTLNLNSSLIDISEIQGFIFHYFAVKLNRTLIHNVIKNMTGVKRVILINAQERKE
jgi:hypothetical protein